MDRFEWDPNKAAANERKHRVSFELAMEAMTDPRALISVDEEHSEDELRERLLGLSAKGVLLVVYVARLHQRGSVFRIITARKATRSERRDYDEANR